MAQPANSAPVAAAHDTLDDLPPDACALLDSAGQQDYQRGSAWFDNFVRHVHLAPATPEFHLWRLQGHTQAVLPLLRLQATGVAQALGNYYTTRYAPALADGLTTTQAVAALNGIVRGLLRGPAPAHTLQFGPVRQGSAEHTLLRQALQQAGCAVFDSPAFQNWTLPVTQDWPAYLASRDGRLRTTLSRMGKRFAAQGGRLEVLTGGDGLERAIAAYQSVYAASWKTPEPHAQFMPALIRSTAAQGLLRMGVAWLGEQAVAAQVWMVQNGRADIYKLAHDEQHKQLSPGTLLTARLMQHVMETDRVQLVDYLSGDDAYKRLWMSTCHMHVQVHAYSLRSPQGLVRAARHAASRGWHRLRTTRPDTGQKP